MPEAIRYCGTDGFFEGDRCPTCGAAGRAVVGGSRRRQLSKFISGALRHFPDDAGIDLDGAGWTELASLVAAVEEQYDWADREAVLGVVTTDPKGRFERDGTGRVRAAYGHSVDVDLESGDDPVPATLYHGTAPRNLDSILAEGLRPMGRQQVHLSAAVADAIEVGKRHADEPVVLAVDAEAMTVDGHDGARRPDQRAA
jgi:putative RNA 2'-phosphotransferase